MEILKETQIRQTKILAALGDLFDLPVEGIVNAANQRMLGGGGLDGLMHRRAGPELLAACKELPEIRPGCRLEIGGAAITNSFDIQKQNSKIRFIIHAVGPDCHDPKQNQNRKVLLGNAYLNSLLALKEKGGKSIAFPAISTGIFGYPFEEAQEVAFETAKTFAQKNPNGYDLILFVYTDQRYLKEIEKAWIKTLND